MGISRYPEEFEEEGVVEEVVERIIVVKETSLDGLMQR